MVLGAEVPYTNYLQGLQTVMVPISFLVGSPMGWDSIRVNPFHSDTTWQEGANPADESFVNA